MKKVLLYSTFKLVIFICGLTFSLISKTQPLKKPVDHSKISPLSNQSEHEARASIEVHRLQNDALEKLQNIINCSPAINVETLSIQIQDSLKPYAEKFLDQQSDPTVENKEKPISLQVLKGTLKNEKLANYFYKVFSKLSESKTSDDYLKEAIRTSAKKAALETFNSIHDQDLSKILLEAAQAAKSKAPPSAAACKTKSNTLVSEIDYTKKRLKEAEKNAREAATNPSNRKAANDEYDSLKLKLENLLKAQRVQNVQKLSDTINQKSEITEELSKKIPIPQNLNPDKIAELQARSEELSSKESAFKAAEEAYKKANKDFDSAIRDPKTDIDNTNIRQNRTYRESDLKKAQKELETSRDADKNFKNIQKYALTLKNIEDEFNVLKESPDSAMAKETIEYIQKNHPALIKDGKVKISSSEEITEVKKALLKKWTQVPWYKKAYQACKKTACEIINWYTDYDGNF